VAGENLKRIERVRRVQDVCVIEHEDEGHFSLLEPPNEPRKSNSFVERPPFRERAHRRSAGGVDAAYGLEDPRGHLPHLVVARLERHPGEPSLIDL
jgi:hypothetical protein